MQNLPTKLPMPIGKFLIGFTITKYLAQPKFAELINP